VLWQRSRFLATYTCISAFTAESISSNCSCQQPYLSLYSAAAIPLSIIVLPRSRLLYYIALKFSLLLASFLFFSLALSRFLEVLGFEFLQTNFEVRICILTGSEHRGSNFRPLRTASVLVT
jgi:hypothetical protein